MLTTCVVSDTWPIERYVNVHVYYSSDPVIGRTASFRVDQQAIMNRVFDDHERRG